MKPHSVTALAAIVLGCGAALAQDVAPAPRVGKGSNRNVP
jgi:hypothetical protein